MSLANIDQKGVSVVICCYNSRQRIGPTIEHLMVQKGIYFPWEVILVDNNSNDGTADLATEIWDNGSSPCPLRIVKELRPGTMFARKCGIEESSYRYLLFCDDDNWLHEHYILTAYSLIKGNNAISVIGGIGLLEFEPGHQPPSWISKYIKSFGGPQGKKDGDITFEKGCLYTAGAILDRCWLDKLYSCGFESTLKGRDGKTLQAGEDTELTFALKLIGSRLHYSSQLHFKHFMPRGRMNWTYLKRMWESFGYADFLISPYKAHFRKAQQKPAIVHRFERLIVLVKFYVLALLSSFEEGNSNVLKYYRSLGKFKACLYNSETFFRNVKMVEKLSVETKHLQSDKI